jgi:hypothetical protein
MMRSRRAVVALVLAIFGAACSSSRNGVVPTATTTGHAVNPPVTVSRPPAEASLAAATEPWTLPAAVSRPVVLPAGSGFVILGGLATGDTSTSRIVAVDPAHGVSRIIGHLAVALHDGSGAVLGGRFFVFGGGSTGTLSVVQVWTAGSAAEVSTLPEARSDLAAVTVGGTAYLVGGFNGSAMTADVLATVNGLSFRPVAHLAVPVRYPAVAGLGHTLWVVGGVTSTSEGGTTDTDVVQTVDLLSGRVTVAGRTPLPLGHATALTVAGQIFVVGGRAGTEPSAAIWRLNPATGSLAPAGRLPEPVSDAASVVVGGVGYLVGGEVSGPVEPLDTVVALRPRPQS